MRSNNDRRARLVVLGIPGSRRVASFCAAAQAQGARRIEVVPYVDFIAGRAPAVRPGSLVRIESPGACAATTRAILKAGIAPLAAVGGTPFMKAEIDRLACDRGEILHPRQWYFGFRTILEQLARDWSVEGVEWMSHPLAVATTFDKRACLERWAEDGLPVPPQHPRLSSYAQIREALPDRHARLFVKLRYGYSAIGAVALQWRGSQVRALTTTEVVPAGGRARLFVSKKPRVVVGEAQIAWLIDTLAAEEILVEDWLPKALWRGKVYDLRILVIGGRVEHVVGRASGSPFTNLNLDAERIPRETVQQHLGPFWADMELLSARAAERIPQAGVLGLDVLVRPCLRRFAILEANAFGDYLPGLLHRGRSTYEAEVERFWPLPVGACV